MTDFDETAASAPAFYATITDLLEKAKFDECVRLARQERTTAQENANKPAEIAALRLVIKGQLGKNDGFNARKNAEEAMAIAKGDKTAEAAITHLLAQVSLVEGSFDAATKDAEAAIDKFKALKDKSGEAAAANTLAKVYIGKGMLVAALEKANESQAIFSSIGEKMGEASALSTVFDIKCKEERMYQALVMVETMLKIYTELGSMTGEAASQLKAAQVLLEQGDLESVIERAASAMQLYDEIGDLKKKGMAVYYMSMALQRNGQLQDAMAAAETAGNLFQEGRDRKGHVLALKLMAECFMSTKELNNAAVKLEEAAFKYRQMKDKTSEAKTLVELAQTQLAALSNPTQVPARGWTAEDAEMPLRNARAAMKIFSESGKTKTPEYGSALLVVAAGLMNPLLSHIDGRLDDSKSKAEEATSIFQSAGELKGEALATKILAQVLFAISPANNKDESLALLEQSRELAEEAVAQDMSKDVTKLIKEYSKWQPAKKGGAAGGTTPVDIDQWRQNGDYVMFIRGYQGRAAVDPAAAKASSSSLAAGGKIQRQQVLYQLRYQRVQKVDMAAAVVTA